MKTRSTNPGSPKPRTLSRHHRHLVELASLLTTAGLADAFADLFGTRRNGADALVVIGVALIISTVAHHVWLRRTNHAPPAGSPAHPIEPFADGATPSAVPSSLSPALLSSPSPSAATGAFWKVRTGIDNTPGRLAVLAGALAAAGANIHALEAYPAADGVVDEFLVEASRSTTAEQLCGAVRAVGGRDVRAVPADVLDLLDAPTRALELAASLALRPADFGPVVAELLEADSVTSTDAESGATPAAWIDGTTLVLRRADGRTYTVSRPELSFTGTELSRARALADLADKLLAGAPDGVECSARANA